MTIGIPRYSGGFSVEWSRAKQTCKRNIFGKTTIRHSEGKPEKSVSTMFYRLFHSKDSETSSEWQTNDCHPELSWILFHKKSLLTTLRCRSPDFLFLRVCAIASHYTKSACFRVWLTKNFRKKILRLKPQNDDTFSVILRDLSRRICFVQNKLWLLLHTFKSFITFCYSQNFHSLFRYYFGLGSRCSHGVLRKICLGFPSRKTVAHFAIALIRYVFRYFGSTFTSFTSATSRKTIHRIVFLGRVEIRVLTTSR